MQIEPRENFTPQEAQRYSRNALLAQVGWEGQARWRAGRVLVVGAGGIGSAALLYLAAAGVGRLGLVDGDAVELSNLQRQILHQSDDLGRRKVESAADSLSAINPLCRVQTFDLRLNPANVREVIQGFEVVLDASDNFSTRFLVAECCWRYKIPLVSAAATGWHGQLLVAQPLPENPCYRCLVPEAPPAAAVPPSTQIGILGAVAGAMGCLQVAFAENLYPPALGVGHQIINPGSQGLHRPPAGLRPDDEPVKAGVFYHPDRTQERLRRNELGSDTHLFQVTDRHIKHSLIRSRDSCPAVIGPGVQLLEAPGVLGEELKGVKGRLSYPIKHRPPPVAWDPVTK